MAVVVTILIYGSIHLHAMNTVMQQIVQDLTNVVQELNYAKELHIYQIHGRIDFLLKNNVTISLNYVFLLLLVPGQALNLVPGQALDRVLNLVLNLVPGQALNLVLDRVLNLARLLILILSFLVQIKDVYKIQMECSE
jgi:hypothetical protein